MQMLVICDTADIVDVPQYVIENRELYRRRFLKWIQNKSVKHKYWIKNVDGSVVLCYRTDAFVEWLNKKVIENQDEQARIIAATVDETEYRNLPSTWF